MALLCIGTSGRLKPAGQAVAIVLKGHSHAFSVNEALMQLQVELRSTETTCRAPSPSAQNRWNVMVGFKGNLFLDLLERLTLLKSP